MLTLDTTLICPLQPEAHFCGNSGQLNNWDTWQTQSCILRSLGTTTHTRKAFRTTEASCTSWKHRNGENTPKLDPTLIWATWIGLIPWSHVLLGTVILQTNRRRVYTLHIQQHSTTFNIIQHHSISQRPGRWSSTCQTRDPIVGLCKWQRPRHTWP